MGVDAYIYDYSTNILSPPIVLGYKLLKDIRAIPSSLNVLMCHDK
jgi:hypothetical protein